MKRRILFASLAFLLPLVLCACKSKSAGRSSAAHSSPGSRTITVFAAASLTESFGDLGKQFEIDHPEVQVVFNFAGSQQLLQQLQQGASADVFASAAPKEMAQATTAGLVGADAAQDFATNRLVVIFPAGKAKEIKSLADLAQSGIKIDLADPAVPVGAYTLEMLDRMSRDPAYGPDYKTKVLASVVSREENVKAVLGKVRLGEVDAGVVYVTDVTGQASSEVGQLPVPEAFNVIAHYPIAMVTKAARPKLAREFMAFVISPAGQEILHRHGFAPADAATHPSP